jgi:hypothetical protein
MDPRGGRLPPFIRPAQPKVTTFIEFLRSTDLTVMLVAACILLGALIAIGAATMESARWGAAEVQQTAVLG